MFEMTKKELENWRSQFATSNREIMGMRITPFVFTEHGILMLSSVLNSKRAIEVNIHIMRIFIRMRELLLAHNDMFLKIEEVEKRVLQQDEKIQLIFEYLKQLTRKKEDSRRQIGFKKEEKPQN